MVRSLYDVLGVDEDASRARIARAYRERAQQFHPDVNDHPRAREQFTLLSTASDVLRDPDERDRYDELGHETYVREHLPDLPAPPMDADGTAGNERDPDRDAPDGDDRTPAGRPDGSQGLGSRFTPGATAPGEDGSSGTAPPTGGPAPNPSGPPGSPEAPGRATPTDGGTTGGVSWEQSRRRQAVREKRSHGHLTASFQWVPLVLAAVLYGFGVGRYLRLNRDGFAAVAAVFRDGGVAAGLTAVHGRTGVGTALSFVRAAGVEMSTEMSFGAVFVLGAGALAAVTTWSVRKLRRTTNWVPSWLHAACAAGPAAALVLAVAVERAGLAVLPTVPLWFELTLLAVLPTLAVVSFLLNRFVLVMPLVRRD